MGGHAGRDARKETVLMKILITGAGGFIGKNLTFALQTKGYTEILPFYSDTPAEKLERYCTECNFVFHLAGVNRPKTQDEFMQDNFGFTDVLLRTLLRNNNHCPVMFASSTQAALPNLYGRSKKAGEELLFQYRRETGAKVFVVRLPYVFGKWSKPNYNNVIATFCYDALHDLPITIAEPERMLQLSYIDDVTDTLVNLIEGEPVLEGPYCVIPIVYKETLGDIAQRIRSFGKIRDERIMPDLSAPLTRKLYVTYLSFLPAMEFAYPLEVEEDDSGYYAEFLYAECGGQISVCVVRPGENRGNHWHRTRAEKILVASGAGVIRFRSPDEQESTEYRICAKKPFVVDVPVGYVHSVENTSKSDLVLLMWASERSNPAHPDIVQAEI
jgi:UDP-2-acetamido-2,6-beta-L-arabino-hexul-4-ose reductase